MSITSALSVALSGLTATSRTAEIVSANLANVLTEGYAPRDIELASRADTKGVRVAGVTRHVDTRLLADRRLADAEAAQAGVRAEFLQEMERQIGPPGEPSSLSARTAAFEASLVTAASRPDDDSRLRAAVDAAVQLAVGLNAASDRLQTLRTEADTRIASTVKDINGALEQVTDLNRRIVTARSSGRSAAGLQDQRQVVIDRLAQAIPIVQAPRENGTVALYSTGGAMLLDGRPASLEFAPSNVVAPHMSGQNGLLSGLKINGVDIDAWSEQGAIAGGRLAGLFAVRDDLAVQAQSRIDAVARTLVDRFQDPSLDPTRTPGDAGLFTDNGAAFDPANETGLSGRIAVNSVVDDAWGGAAWRLRDGLNAAAPGPAGAANLLQSLQSRLSDRQGMPSGDLGPTERSFSGHVGSLSAMISQDRVAADQAGSFAQAARSELVALEKEGGVDSDAEMQRLLVIEQAYAANARMIQTADEMMETLLRI